jgi:outer membrane immunogenic protein
MLRKVLLASVLILASGSSFAADLPSRVAPAPYGVAPLFTWTGFYVGAQVGYGWGNAPSPYGVPSTATTYTLAQNASKQKGAFGGVHVGYNQQFGSFVLGIEADANIDGVKGNDSGSGGHVNGVNHNWNASVRARAGITPIDRVLLYVTGGVAFLDGKATKEAFAPFESVNTTWTGWTAGVGAEYALTNNITARLEYRYTDYGHSVARFPVNGYAERISPRVNAVLAGISYKF